jgi:hypothetical protein
MIVEVTIGFPSIFAAIPDEAVAPHFKQQRYLVKQLLY